MKSRPPGFPDSAPTRRILWGAFAAWIAFVWVLSSIPGHQLSGPNFPHADKVAHFLIFLLGSLLFGAALRATFSWRWPVLMIAAALALGLFGVVDEMRQTLTPGRSGADLGDMTADALGAVFGVLLLRLLYGYGKLPKKTNCAAPQRDRAAQ